MTNTEARSIILKELSKSGYEYKEINSKSTDSMYYKISSGESSLLFRISDHPTQKDVITFRIDKHKNRENLQKFVKNRISDLSYRVTKTFLGLR